MKKGIHPEYHNVTATCHCGESYEIASFEKELRIDICAACHPLFSGKGTHKVLDSEGVVNKFKNRYKKTDAIQAEIQARKERQKLVAVEEEERKSRKKSRVIGKTAI